MSLKIFPCLSNGEKMNFKNFSREIFFSKLRDGINGVREFQYDTICSQNFVSIGSLVWKLLGGGPKFYTDTHTHTHTETHTHRHTHTDTYTHTHTHTHRLPIL